MIKICQRERNKSGCYVEGEQRSKREIDVYAFMLNTFRAHATEQTLNKLHYEAPVKIIINIYKNIELFCLNKAKLQCKTLYRRRLH